MTTKKMQEAAKELLADIVSVELNIQKIKPTLVALSYGQAISEEDGAFLASVMAQMGDTAVSDHADELGVANN